jgi:hypothetical protein
MGWLPDCSLINGKTKAAHIGIVCSLSVEQPFAMALLHCSMIGEGGKFARVCSSVQREVVVVHIWSSSSEAKLEIQ